MMTSIVYKLSGRELGFRRASILILALLLLGGAAGAAEGPIELNFWNPLSSEPARSGIAARVKAFNESQSEIHVTTLNVQWNAIAQKLLTAVAGRVPPDVTIFDRFMVASYGYRGVFEDLGDWIKSAGINPADFYPAAWEECFARGKQYALPYDTDDRMMFYNRELFREAGLDPDKPPTTWPELREVSLKLTKFDKSGRITQMGFYPMFFQNGVGNTYFYLFAFLNGGHYLSSDGWTAEMDNPQNVEAMQWCVDFVNDYGVDKLVSFWSGFGIEEMNPFFQKKVAMWVDTPSFFGLIKRYCPNLDYGVADFPHPVGGAPATWSGGWSFIIPQGSRHSEAAKKFILFMTSKEQQIAFCKEVRTLPTLVAAANSPEFLGDDPRMKVCVDAMKHSRSRPVSPAAAVLWDENIRAGDFALRGKLTPAEALKRSNAEIQRYLDQLRHHEEFPLINAKMVALWLGLGVGVILLARGIWSVWRIRRSRLWRKEGFEAYAFALPSILFLLVLMLGPLLASVVLSFTSYDILRPARWVGLSNYNDMLAKDPLFWRSLWNTAYFTLLATPLGIATALALALLLNCRLRGQSILRTLFFLPSIVPVVAGSLLWLWLFNGDYGLLNSIARMLHLPGTPYPWLNDAAWAKPSIIIMSLWGVGSGMIICLAALQGVPRELYEAALIDGASTWHKFRHVTIPIISPTLLFLAIMGVIGGLQIFAQAYIMTEGGPTDSTSFFVYYLYKRGFKFFEMGYASALAWVLFFLVVVVTALQFYVSRRWVHYEGGASQ